MNIKRSFMPLSSIYKIAFNCALFVMHTSLAQGALTLEIATEKTILIPGETIPVAIKIQNSGSEAVTNPRAEITIPGGLTYQSYTASSGAYLNGAPGVWSLASNLAAGQSETLLLQLYVDKTGPAIDTNVYFTIQGLSEDGIETTVSYRVYIDNSVQAGSVLFWELVGDTLVPCSTPAS